MERKKKWKEKSDGNKRNRKNRNSNRNKRNRKRRKIGWIERNRKREMKTLACGTKQLKSVIAKENLKKPKQTQKKTSEQIVFVELWAWYFLESQNLTVLCGTSKCWLAGADALWWLYVLPRGIFKKAKAAGWWYEQLDDGKNSGAMTVTEWRWHKLQDDDCNSKMTAGRG